MKTPSRMGREGFFPGPPQLETVGVGRVRLQIGQGHLNGLSGVHRLDGGFLCGWLAGRAVLKEKFSALLAEGVNCDRPVCDSS